jgi:hypothetical protein
VQSNLATIVTDQKVDLITGEHVVGYSYELSFVIIVGWASNVHAKA